jgi:hypothetical protein
MCSVPLSLKVSAVYLQSIEVAVKPIDLSCPLQDAHPDHLPFLFLSL